MTHHILSVAGPGHTHLGEAPANGVLERRTAEYLPPAVARCSLTIRVPPGSAREAIDSDEPALSVVRPAGTRRADWFCSQRGNKFHRCGAPGDNQPLQLEVRVGRSSNIVHSWPCLSPPEHGAVIVSSAWSGNWASDVTLTAGGGTAVTRGINPWKFFRTATAVKPFVAPEILAAWGTDRFAPGWALATAVGGWVAPKSAWSQVQPMEWNHWWPYEDAEIVLVTFVENAQISAWFGRPGAAIFWEQQRGDWDRENTQRFTCGLTGLADVVRAAGTAFGVWIEAEAIGVDARLDIERPGIIARRDDDPPALPQEKLYVGTRPGRDHIPQVLNRLIARTDCPWIKWYCSPYQAPAARASTTATKPDTACTSTTRDCTQSATSTGPSTRSSAGRSVPREDCVSTWALRPASPQLSSPTRTGPNPICSACWRPRSCYRWHLPCTSPSRNGEPSTATSTSIPPRSISPPSTQLCTRSHCAGTLCRTNSLSSRPGCRGGSTGTRPPTSSTSHHLIARSAVVRPLTAQPMRDGSGERFPASRFDAGAPGPVVIAAIHMHSAPEQTGIRLVGLDSGCPPVPVSGACLTADGLSITADGSAQSRLLSLTPTKGQPRSRARGAVQ